MKYANESVKTATYSKTELLFTLRKFMRIAFSNGFTSFIGFLTVIIISTSFRGVPGFSHLDVKYS